MYSGPVRNDVGVHSKDEFVRRSCGACTPPEEPDVVKRLSQRLISVNNSGEGNNYD